MLSTDGAGQADAAWTRDLQAVWAAAARRCRRLRCAVRAARRAGAGCLTTCAGPLRPGRGGRATRRDARHRPRHGDPRCRGTWASSTPATSGPDASATAWPKDARSRRGGVRAGHPGAQGPGCRRTAAGAGRSGARFRRGRRTACSTRSRCGRWPPAGFGAPPDNVPASAYDASLHEWRVREAIARRDWAGALAGLRRMPAGQRSDSRWTYLEARMREFTGDAAGAKTLLRRPRNRFPASPPTRLDQPYALAVRGCRTPRRPRSRPSPAIRPSCARCSWSRWTAAAGRNANGMTTRCRG